MALGAKALGYKYFGFADHSQSLTIANGLTPERVREQKKAIDALRKKVKGIELFHGIECDILADGALDYDDETLGGVRLRGRQRARASSTRRRKR